MEDDDRTLIELLLGVPKRKTGVRLLDPFEDDNVRAEVNDDAAYERAALQRDLERGDA